MLNCLKGFLKTSEKNEFLRDMHVCIGMRAAEQFATVGNRAVFLYWKCKYSVHG